MSLSTTDSVGNHPGRAAVVAAAVIGLLLVGALIMRHQKPVTTTIAGTVTSGVRAVVFGTVTALAADGRVYSAVIGPDGGYTLVNVPVGPVRIAVSSPDPRPIAVRLATPERGSPGLPVSPSARGENRAGPAATDSSPGRTFAAPGEGPASETPPSREHPDWFRISGRYANPATSGLGTRVEPGKNRVDLHVD